MDESHVRIKKNLTFDGKTLMPGYSLIQTSFACIADFQPAVLKGYRMLFNVKGWGPFVEPAYAGLIPDKDSETHGSVFCLHPDSKAELDRAERWYHEHTVNVTKYYDGHVIENVSVYVSPNVRENLSHFQRLGILHECL